MSWIVSGLYCFLIWLVFAKLKLLRLSLPLAVILASVGPLLLLSLLFCAQYFHPYTSKARVFQRIIPVAPQLQQPGRVTEVVARPNQPIRKGDVLFRVDPVPYQYAVDRLTATLEEAREGESFAAASVKLAEASLKRAQSNLDFATSNRERIKELQASNSVSDSEYEEAINRFDAADAALTQAMAGLAQAKLSVDVARAKTAQTSTQLTAAQYDLEQSTVLAPENGYITNLQLRPGMMVGGGASSSVMSFILDVDSESRGIVTASFEQKNFLRIHEGQYAEVALHCYPGEIMTGRVVNVINVSGDGQLDATGDLPSDLGSGPPSQFAVLIKLDRGEELELPGGSQAQAAIYTEEVQIAGIPIMFLIRAQSWLRYIM